MSDISLSKAVRSNLLSLQNTADLMAKTQNRLATGNKVNSALDNPTNFFTASSLNSRAGDLNQLMDSMANGIQTLQAADNGLSAITKTLESMQSTLRQARQDKSFQTESFGIGDIDTTAQQTLSFKGGSIGDTAMTVDLVANVGATAAAAAAAELEGTAFTGYADDRATTFTLSDGTNSATITLNATSAANFGAAKTYIQSQLDDAGVGITVGDNAGGDGFKFTSTATGTDATVTIGTINHTAGTGGSAAGVHGLTAGSDTGTAAVEGPRAKTVDELVSDINSKLKGYIRASNDNGKLRIENLSTTKLDIEGASGGKVTGSSSAKSDIEGNSVRAGLADQYNELRDQLDKLADDASFNGINLLRGDKLTITFNETGTSSIDINTKGEKAINSANLDIETFMQKATLDSDANIDKELTRLKSALNDVRSQSSAFGSNLSIVQNRQDFTKNMINTLQTGAANLTLADMNEEAANLLALQTRQSLSSSALSMASQADQSVLQLLR
ncbi:MAG: hypothetical protein ABS76_34240 [Pelagibacterium sp. SCN 64-44]|nr:MAG: hypothetical protein ABS76_34240 [Pelagibacterium sp. SCN 64-44]